MPVSAARASSPTLGQEWVWELELTLRLEWVWESETPGGELFPPAERLGTETAWV